MWVNIYDLFVSNLGIDEYFIPYDYPRILHWTLKFFFGTCISSLNTTFSLFSIHCNVVVKVILHTWLRWMHRCEIVLTILLYRPPTEPQHPNTMEYDENNCMLLADIVHTESHNSPLSMMDAVWLLATQPSITVSKIFRSADLQWCNNSMPWGRLKYSNFYTKLISLVDSSAGVHVLI